MKDVEGVQFLQWCLPRLRLRWPGYRKVRRQVYHRIQRRLQSLDLPSLSDYQTYLETHPEEWALLDSYCWIPISRFYRDKSVFLFLEQEVVPQLARQVYENGGRVLRCWSLGCAAGEEPYSLSLLWKLRLKDHYPTVRLDILATDIDEQVIVRAQRGCYPLSSLRDLPETWRTEGFDQTGEEFWIKPEFREPVTFVEQDIRQTAPEETFHLILCRYLPFTYFDAPLQSQTLRQIVERMRPGGAIVIGKGESLPEGEFGLIPWSEKEGVYRRA
jgi:chemotaxis protein methyltransferase CheR